MLKLNAKHCALLIVDMQVGLFRGPEKPYKGSEILDTVNQLIASARQACVPVFVAQHTGPKGSPIEPQSPFWQLLPELTIDPLLDTLFNKTRPSCFLGTELAEQLSHRGIRQLLVAGLKTQYCIDTTCRVAVELGFEPLLIADAHTCMDTPQLPAEQIIKHHNATLEGAFVTLVNSADVNFTGP